MTKREKELLKQLDKLMEDCQAKVDLFAECGMVASMMSSKAVKTAYNNVKEFILNS